MICRSVIIKSSIVVNSFANLLFPSIMSFSKKKADQMKCTSLRGRCNDLMFIIFRLEQRRSTSSWETVKILLYFQLSASSMGSDSFFVAGSSFSVLNSFLIHIDIIIYKMNVINGDWQTSYLYTTALIIIDTLILTFFIRPIMRKDSILKIGSLTFAMSLISVLTFSSVYLDPQQKRREVIKQCTFFIMIMTQLYVIALGIFSGIVTLMVWLSRDTFTKEKIQNYRNQFIILISIFYAFLILMSTIHYYDVNNIIGQNNFWSCVSICGFSIFVLFLVSLPLNHYNISEAVRRKIFHIGPILVIPIISALNINVLVLMLTTAFTMLLILEVIRYKEQELDEDHADVNIFLQFIVKHLNLIYHWMAQFNKREKHFWFTHLFLCLSLLCSYQLPQVIAIKMKLSPHLVLVIIAADAFAAIIGTNWGRVKIYGNKTLEGTTAFILTCFIGSYILIPLNITQLIILSAACGIGELLGGDADNIVTLLSYYGVRFIFVMIIKLKLV